MGGFGQALFWTQAMAGVWMFAATATHGPEMYDFLRAWAFGPPVKVAMAPVGPLDLTCQAPPVPDRTTDNSLTVDDFAVAEDGTVDPAQYLNPKTDKPYEIVQITGQGTGNNFSPGTYYRMPEGVVFLPAMLSIKTDSLPYVSEPLYGSLDRLRCVAGGRNGEVRVNKALLSVQRQRFWETDRAILAYGLGTTGVHLQIVDMTGAKQVPWENDAVQSAATKARLTVPSPETYRAYVKLDLNR